MIILQVRQRLLQDIGIKKIIVDPGIGFGKRVEDNLALIERLEDFKSLGFPILIGIIQEIFYWKYLKFAC